MQCFASFRLQLVQVPGAIAATSCQHEHDRHPNAFLFISNFGFLKFCGFSGIFWNFPGFSDNFEKFQENFRICHDFHIFLLEFSLRAGLEPACGAYFRWLAKGAYVYTFPSSQRKLP